MIGQTNKQTHRDYNFIYILAWEPSVNQGLIVTPAVYPHFVDFTGKLKVPFKVDSLNKT